MAPFGWDNMTQGEQAGGQQQSFMNLFSMPEITERSTKQRRVPHVSFNLPLAITSEAADAEMIDDTEEEAKANTV